MCVCGLTSYADPPCAACGQFLTVFRRAAAGELDADSGLSQLAKLTEINVDEVGVAGAKQFFQAKVSGCRRCP